ncbi:MAG: class I SAM-dependent methyltransferase [Chloroflexi bacterium]|nr:class I SAM-dependent methyltransferase [Chloroflexota bacterium]
MDVSVGKLGVIALHGSRNGKTRAHDRSAYVSGEYARYFRPEEGGGVFTELYRQKLATVLSLVGGEGMRVLDIGGGMGRMSVPLARWRHRVVLGDISWQVLQNAHGEAVDGLACVVSDAQALPFDDHTFDYVLAIDLLVHLEKPQAALGEIARVLRPNGSLIVDSTNGNPLWTLFYPGYVGASPLRWAQTMLHGGVLPEWQGTVKHYRHAEFARMLAGAGFVVLREFCYGPRLCPKWNLAVAGKAEGLGMTVEGGRCA